MYNPIEYLKTVVLENFPYNDLLVNLCYQVLNLPGFDTGYGSSDKHHAYPGALAQHTAEVMRNALAAANSEGIVVDRRILIPAVIYHDVMKIRDYTSEGKPTDFKSKIYHVAGSYAYWQEAARGLLAPDFIDAVSHCILAHHGRREWKACVEPQTVEAHILHHADLLSATYGKTMNEPKSN